MGNPKRTKFNRMAVNHGGCPSFRHQKNKGSSLEFITESLRGSKKISLQAITQHPTDNLIVLLPLMGYIGFGLANIYFFSLAMKQIPASTAFAIWMGVILAGVKMIEVFLFKEAIKPMDYVYLALILIAIVGLKKS